MASSLLAIAKFVGLPDKNAAWSLGASDRMWQDLHLGGDLHLRRDQSTLQGTFDSDLAEWVFETSGDTPTNIRFKPSGGHVHMSTRLNISQSRDDEEALLINYTGEGRRAVNIIGGDLDVGGGKGCITTSGEVHIHGVGTMNDEDTEELKLRWNEEDEIYQILTAKHGSGSLRGLEIQSKGLTVRGHETGDVPLKVEGAEGQSGNLLEIGQRAETPPVSVSSLGRLNLNSSDEYVLHVLRTSNEQGGIRLRHTRGGNATGTLLFFEANHSGFAGRFINATRGGDSLFTVRGDGRVGIGVDSPSQRLDVAGSQKLSAPTGATSLLLDRVSGQSGEIQFRVDGSHQFSMGAMQNSIGGLGNRFVLGAYYSGGYQPGVVMDSTGRISVGGSDTANGRFAVYTGNAAYPGIIVQASAAQTANLFEAQDSAGNVGARITAAGEFSNNGGYGGSEVFGLGASVGSTNSTAIGRLAYASSAQGAVAIGSDAQATTEGSVAIGRGASATSGAYHSMAIGRNAVAGQRSAIAIGYGVNTGNGRGNIYIGTSLTQKIGGHGQLVIGGPALEYHDIRRVWIGSGQTNTTPRTSITIGTTGGEGENVKGSDLHLAPGVSTGNATPASVVIRSTTAGSSGTTAQTLVDTLTVRDNKVGIGTSEPESPLHVVPKDATTKGLIIQGSAAQTENLLEVQNSAGSVLAGVDSSGMLDATNFRAIRLTRSIPAGEGNYAMLGTFSGSGQRGKVLLVSVSQASGNGRDTSAIWLLATSSYDRGWHTVGPVASSQYNVRAELDVVVWPNGAGNLSLRLRNTSEDTPLGPVRVVIQALAGHIADDWNESTDTGTTTRPPVAPYHPLWVENGNLGVGKASPTEKLDVSGSVAISNQLFISDKAQFDADTTAGNTRLLLYDIDSGQLQRVKVGDDGSGPGGTGRALYIDNLN